MIPSLTGVLAMDNGKPLQFVVPVPTMPYDILRFGLPFNVFRFQPLALGLDSLVHVEVMR